MGCAEGLRVQSYFDGELDASASVEVERHVEACADCAALLQDLQTIREDVRSQAPYHRADRALKAGIANAIARESGQKRGIMGFIPERRSGSRFWPGAASGAGAMALAAALAYAVVLPMSSDVLVDDLMSAHFRSLVGDHLIDVVSSDQHTVKPWFAGHTEVSPPAVDFPNEDYRLVGGRADYVDGRRTAVVVYRHGAHVINVFAWDGRAGAGPDTATRAGYRIACWKNGDLAMCAVSDTGPDELATLTRLLKAAAVSEKRE